MAPLLYRLSSAVRGGPGKSLFPGLALFLWLCVAATPCTAKAPPHISALLDRAREVNLHADRYWHILLHYRGTPGGGIASLIDDPAFFLSETGKHDPQSELEATLRAFFEPEASEENSARCRFPARFAWLNDRMDIEANQPPEIACEEFKEALEKVAPRSAVLVFPGTHINSPASMFGHTLISIGGPYQSKLLSYAVNYSAFTDETNGFAYAAKGIFGLYKGYFSVLPYYQKVREYGDLERRDVWEYPLNLDEAETKRMFLHIWELREIYSDYFFFDENCAYQLLFLLEAARPSLHLTDRTRPWVIPIDTVRAIREAGLIETSHYRPSKATRISRLALQMNKTEQEIALRVLDGSLPPDQLPETGMSPKALIRILDLATESVEFSYFKEKLTQDEYRNRYLALLAARSRLGPPSEEPDWVEPVRPDLGHGSNRFSLGGGFRDGRFYQQLKIRPAYHDLLDADAGYIAGAQIDFADLVLRYYPEREKIELYNINLIDIFSLAPRNRFFKPISWKVRTGFLQRLFDDGDDHLVYQLTPGGGFSYGNKDALVYTMIETELLVSGRFRDSFAFGVGGSVGALVKIGNRWKVHAAVRHLWHEIGDPHRGLEMRLDQALVTGTASSVNLSVLRERIYDHSATDVGVTWNLFW